jgi:hypothetical protein
MGWFVELLVNFLEPILLGILNGIFGIDTKRDGSETNRTFDILYTLLYIVILLIVIGLVVGFIYHFCRT